MARKTRVLLFIFPLSCQFLPSSFRIHHHYFAERETWEKTSGEDVWMDYQAVTVHTYKNTVRTSQETAGKRAGLCCFVTFLKKQQLFLLSSMADSDLCLFNRWTGRLGVFNHVRLWTKASHTGVCQLQQPVNQPLISRAGSSSAFAQLHRDKGRVEILDFHFCLNALLSPP